MDKALLGQDSKDRLQIVAAKFLVSLEGQLEGRAFHVIHQDVQVVWIDQGPLR